MTTPGPLVENTAAVRAVGLRPDDRGPRVDIDYARSTITFEAATFSFDPLSPVAQALLVAGGAEAIVKERLEAVCVDD